MSVFVPITTHWRELMGIQHAPKSQRNRAKKRRKARKHKLRSTKKYKAK
jgi:hypothetical protein